jgi:hypothetical protein
MNLTLRPGTPGDAERCGTVCYEAFKAIADRHQFPPDCPSAQTAVGSTERRFSHASYYAVVAELEGDVVGEGNAALRVVIGAASEFSGPGFLLPTRNGPMFRWCLEQGLRIVQPMTLMSIGLYNEPQGVFLPSIVY